METEELKRKRKEFLDDTLKYYGEDVSRRAIEILGPDQTYCRYKTTDGKKCAIGRHISDDKYDSAIEGCGISEKMASVIPKEIMDLGLQFLTKIQLIHDCDDNWNNHGLSDHGIQVVAQIEQEFGL